MERNQGSLPQHHVIVHVHAFVAAEDAPSAGEELRSFVGQAILEHAKQRTEPWAPRIVDRIDAMVPDHEVEVEQLRFDAGHQLDMWPVDEPESPDAPAPGQLRFMSGSNLTFVQVIDTGEEPRDGDQHVLDWQRTPADMARSLREAADWFDAHRDDAVDAVLG